MATGGGSGFSVFAGQQIHSGFEVSVLFQCVDAALISAKAQLLTIQQRRSSISIGDMFNMQMLMNHLSQLTEMTTNVVSAAHSSILSMTRNLKA